MTTSSEKSNPLKIVIGLATRGNDICASLVNFLLRNSHVNGTRFIYKACAWSAPLVQELVFQEAANLDPDYLLMVDSDVTPPFDALEEMIKREKDLISAPIWHYNAGTGEIHLNAHKEFCKRIRSTDFKGIEKIKTTSFGCLLISQKVLRKFKELKESFVNWSPFLGEEFKPQSSDVIFFGKCEKRFLSQKCDQVVEGKRTGIQKFL